MVQNNTLVDVVIHHAEQLRAQNAFTYVRVGTWDTEQISYEMMALRAKAIAARLQQVACRGERVALCYPSGLHYIAAFLGSLFAGSIAVPLFPPSNHDPAERIGSAISDAGAKFGLTTKTIFKARRRLFEQLQIEWLFTDEVPDDLAERWRDPNLKSADIAFLQYTSGSTARPKGVIVTHQNLLANQQAIAQRFGHTKDTRVGGWLPLFHDMGLIGNVLQPLYVGCECVLMSPLDFMRRPMSWLELISRFGLTTSGGPDFAYRLCCRRSTALPPLLDLSTWTVAFCGSEPVRAATLGAFCNTFESAGFSRDSFLPCYGLAEATLLVSARRRNTALRVMNLDADMLGRGEIREIDSVNPGASRKIVSCGTVVSDHQIWIKPWNMGIGPGPIGEICVSGPSISQGYWTGHSTGEAGFVEVERPSLETGDAGFIQGGELFVTGRIKDVLIVRGRNYHAEDLEHTIDALAEPLLGSLSCAFSVEVGSEEVAVIVAESNEADPTTLRELIARLRTSVLEAHQLSVFALALVKSRALPVTTSGKIRRAECKRLFQSGQLKYLSSWSRDDTIFSESARALSSDK